ncbi:GmrSD restriction endonuclease domain-containing protein, partial [Priestia megaterium]
LLTIEHYIPESNIKLGVSGDIIGSVGNLLLVDEVTNNNVLKNSATEEKYKILNNSGYPLTQTYISSHSWSEREVKNRTESIAKQLYEMIILS